MFESIRVVKKIGKKRKYVENKRRIISMNFKSFNQIIVPIVLIFIGESLIFLDNPINGLLIHMFNMLVIFILIIVDRNLFTIFKDQKVKFVFQSLILLLLLRIINMTLPDFFISTMVWMFIIYGVMYIPIYSILKFQDFTLKEIGLNCNRLIIYLPASIILGLILGLIESQIIQPFDPELDNMAVTSLLFLYIILMFLFIGLVEELVFRSILQTRLENALGMKQGLVLASVLFGIMHTGYGTIYEILFAIIAGLIIGFIFQKTRSLPFVVGIHGTINFFVFAIVPYLL